VGKLIVAPLQEFENPQVPIVMTLGVFGCQGLQLRNDTGAKAFERYGVQFAERFPIGLWQGARHLSHRSAIR
jgi:hypothetical protein